MPFLKHIHAIPVVAEIAQAFASIAEAEGGSAQLREADCRKTVARALPTLVRTLRFATVLVNFRVF